MRRLATVVDVVDLLGALGALLLITAATAVDWRLGVALTGGLLLALALLLAQPTKPSPPTPPAEG